VISQASCGSSGGVVSFPCSLQGCSLLVVGRWTLGVGSPHVRKCHQVSSKEHIQLAPTRLGRPLGPWHLAPPRATPRLGGVCVCVSCQDQYFPLPTSLAPLYSPCATSAFDWGSNSHSRSAPAPVESPPGAPNALSVLSVFHPRDSRFAFRAIWLQNEIETTVLPRAPRRDAQSCSPRQTKSRAATYRRASGSLDKTDGPGAFLWLVSPPASEITNHPVSFTTATFSPPPAERRRTTEMGVFQTHGHMICDLGSCLLCFVSPYQEILIPVSPRYEVGKGAAFATAAHVRLRGISGNSCALRSRVFGHQACAYRPPLAVQVVRSQYLLLGGFEIAQLAAVECATRARRLACNAAGRSAQKSERGLSYVVRDAEMRNCAGW
jgi:hypothetical protein